MFAINQRFQLGQLVYADTKEGRICGYISDYQDGDPEFMYKVAVENSREIICYDSEIYLVDIEALLEI